MPSKKIFNDPVYGFIAVPYGLIFDLVEHPYFQRLRQIKQVSLSHYVYPGALHTRFHHALGAFHLMSQAIEVLRSKGAEITDEEATAVSAAILLHDIGHGPFSHTLEHTLIPVGHERLSEWFMESLNHTFGGALDMAIAIFRDRYPKRFLYQLVSGQLDMDRLDYLTRDSFFTGVYEGVVGYDRIIKMLAVYDNRLVVEEKGIYAIEKFLTARRLMYWQVYLHKTVLAAEQMLVQTLQRARMLGRAGTQLPCPEALSFFLYLDIGAGDFEHHREALLQQFANLDDCDVMSALKSWAKHPDKLLAFLSKSLINRRLFKLELSGSPFPEAYLSSLKSSVAALWPGEPDAPEVLVLSGTESNSAYNTAQGEIDILFKNGEVRPMSESTDYEMHSRTVTKYYVAYPKLNFAEGK
ncbi:MAG: HD domain-containing protein [Saprospiraceae bacterium]|jgi:HD superfamily phosphohydrolase